VPGGFALLRAAIGFAALAVAAGTAPGAHAAGDAPAAVTAPGAAAPPKGPEPIPVPRRPEDQFFLANRYLLGRGLEADPVRANELFRMAAQRGHDRAQLQLGLSYLKGRGIERNPVLAMEWIGKSADQNNGRALMELGVAHWNGYGVRLDRVEAVKFLLLSQWAGSPAGYAMIRRYAAELTPEQRQEALGRARQWRTDHGLPAEVEPPRGSMIFRPS
jgi:TPR repeat protein